jgi:hypothetical protein
MKMTTMMMTRREGADEEEAGAGVLRASGANAENTEEKDGKDDDGVGKTGDAGGVLRAFGADADGMWRTKIEKTTMKMVRLVMMVVCYAPLARMLVAYREKRWITMMMTMIMTARDDVIRMGEGGNRVQSRR